MKTTKMKITVTVELLEGIGLGSVHDAIKHVKSEYKSYPESPKKPFLKRDHSVAEAKEYATALEKYTKENLEYKRKCDEVHEYNRELDSVLEEYLKKESGLTKLPKDRQDKIWSKAWSDGHSNGYGEVYGHLCSLVDLFV